MLSPSLVKQGVCLEKFGTENFTHVRIRLMPKCKMQAAEPVNVYKQKESKKESESRAGDRVAAMLFLGKRYRYFVL